MWIIEYHSIISRIGVSVNFSFINLFISCFIYFIILINFILIISLYIWTTQRSFWNTFLMFVLSSIFTVLTTNEILVWLIFIQAFIDLQVIFVISVIRINISRWCPNIDLLVWLLCHRVWLWFLCLVIHCLFFFTLINRYIWTLFVPVRTLVMHLDRGLVNPLQSFILPLTLFAVWVMLSLILVICWVWIVIRIIVMVWNVVLHWLTLVHIQIHTVRLTIKVVFISMKGLFGILVNLFGWFVVLLKLHVFVLLFVIIDFNLHGLEMCLKRSLTSIEFNNSPFQVCYPLQQLLDSMRFITDLIKDLLVCCVCLIKSKLFH